MPVSIGLSEFVLFLAILGAVLMGLSIVVPNPPGQAMRWVGLVFLIVGIVAAIFLYALGLFA